MNNSTRSLIHDILQIGSLAYIVFSGPIITINIILTLFQLLVVLILIISGYEMRRTMFYRVPDVGRQKELVTTGIYKFIRNPMYLAQILLAGILVINYYSIFRLISLVIQITNFIFKIQYEEQLLQKNFKEFSKYKKSSWRLIPFIY